MRTIRASEIGAFIYCQRAWWYRLQGVEPANQAELAAGSELHQQHGRRVIVSGLLSGLGWLLLLAAVVLMAVYLTGRLLQ